MILRENYEQRIQVLVHDDGHPAQVDDVVTDFRGDKARLVDGRAPHKPSSTGFVYTMRGSSTTPQQSYTGVFGLKWVDYD